MRISDWSSDVCSSDLPARRRASQSAAESGLPRQLEPTPVDTVSPSRDRTTVTAARSMSVSSLGLAPSTKSPADALSAIVSTIVMSQPAIRLSTIRSEEHTSELQSTNAHLVCRLLLEKKKKDYHTHILR